MIDLTIAEKPRTGAVLLSMALSLWVLLAATALYADAIAPLPMRDGLVHEGAASCASSNCHGSVSGKLQSNIVHNEYSIWDKKDAHSRAYENLASKASRAITDKLGLKAAQEEPVCLSCHASHLPKKLRGKKSQIADGIDCESCHGGAENWLATHSEKDVRHADNVARGLYPAADIVPRTQLCLSCHYGNAEQFLSHEIISAGHPRLSFEMNAFSESMPPHFVQDEDYKKRKTTYSKVKIWAVGQALTADSVLKMLRSNHLQPGKLFPELGLFDCYSCHHPISDKSWAPRRGTGLGPGVVPINDSSLLMLRHVIVPLNAEHAWQLRKLLKELQLASATGYMALLEKVDELQVLVELLTALVVEHEFSAQDIQEITLSLINEGIWGEYQDYISAEQSVLAIKALTTSWDRLIPFQESRRNAIRDDIDKLHKMVTSEKSYEPKLFVEVLRSLRAKISGS